MKHRNQDNQNIILVKAPLFPQLEKIGRSKSSTIKTIIHPFPSFMFCLIWSSLKPHHKSIFVKKSSFSKVFGAIFCHWSISFCVLTMISPGFHRVFINLHPITVDFHSIIGWPSSYRCWQYKTHNFDTFQTLPKLFYWSLANLTLSSTPSSDFSSRVSVTNRCNNVISMQTSFWGHSTNALITKLALRKNVNFESTNSSFQMPQIFAVGQTIKMFHRWKRCVHTCAWVIHHQTGNDFRHFQEVLANK